MTVSLADELTVGTVFERFHPAGRFVDQAQFQQTLVFHREGEVVFQQDLF
jgi:hypothetical protein